jgi:hypothetical protein
MLGFREGIATKHGKNTAEEAETRVKKRAEEFGKRVT